MEKQPKAAVVIGSDSDYGVVKGALEQLDKFGIAYEIHVMSAHRTPEDAAAFAKNAQAAGFGVIIGAAGKAAHLPGVLAAYTILPVIGLPIRSSTMDGLDSLLSIVQMPKGIPVATVAVDGAANAGILAAQILAGEFPQIKDKLQQFKVEMAEEVRCKDKALAEKIKSEK